MAMIVLKLAALAVAALLAQDPPPAVPPAAPAAESATPAAVPDGPLAAGAKLSPDASVEQVLDALHRRGEGLKDFTADVTLLEMDPSLGDSSARKGTAVYQRKGEGDARILVVFDRKEQGKKIFDQKVEYLLDNGWLVERDHERKNEVRRQVLQPGEKVDLLKLGEGPFPLPVGQPRQDVEKLFEVTKIAARPKDPADTVHVRLKPREGTQFARKFDSIDVWVNTASEMPQRIETLDVGQNVLRRTDLTLTGINTGLKDADFTLPPVPAGWNRHEDRYVE